MPEPSLRPSTLAARRGWRHREPPLRYPRTQASLRVNAAAPQRSPPPCGEGTGVGQRRAKTPPAALRAATSPQGGGVEQAASHVPRTQTPASNLAATNRRRRLGKSDLPQQIGA